MVTIHDDSIAFTSATAATAVYVVAELYHKEGCIPGSLKENSGWCGR